MAKHRKKKGKRWDHPDYKKGVYCFERDGYIHTYIFGQRKSIKNLPWDKQNKEFAIQVLSKRLKEYYEIQNGMNSNKIETFSELFELYKEFRFRKIKRKSKISFLSGIKQMMLDNDIRLNDNIEISRYFTNRATSMKEEGYANSTIRRAISSIRAVFQFGIEQEIIKSNPIKKWMIPDKEGFKYVICTRKQLEKVISVSKTYAESAKKLYHKAPRLKLYYTLRIISHTGMRIGEVINLKTDYILEDKLLIFGKGDKWREFPYSVSDGLKELMDEVKIFHNEYFKEDDYLLGTQDHRLISTLLTTFKKKPELSDCEEVKFHAIRKLVENEMMNDYTLNDNVVRSLMGHTIQTQSQHYINKLSAEDIEKVIATNKLKKKK